MTKTKIMLKGGPMEKKNEAKKIRWNIANAMTCVLETIKESKGKVKKTNQINKPYKLNDYSFFLLQECL